MLAALVEEARQGCEASLRQPDLLAVEEALRRKGATPADCVATVRTLAETGGQTLAARLKASVAEEIDTEEGSFERFLLVHCALQSADTVPELPVTPKVGQLFCDAFRFFARSPDKRSRPKFQVGKSSFLSMCKIATLRRFPAGEFEWEVSGLPRSWMLKVERRALPRVAYFVARELKGFGPVFFPHLGVLRPKRIMLVEREINRSYHRMAKSLALQRDARGLVTSSWFYSPDIGRASPHLAWLPEFFLENGGLVVNMGAAGAQASGALSRSNQRKEMYQAGEFTPMLGLVIWPRKEMLRWAAAHPEFGD